MADSTTHPMLQLMAEVARNPALHKAFRKNPKRVMSEHGLSEQQINAIVEAIEKGDGKGILKILGRETIEPDTCFLTIP